MEKKIYIASILSILLIFTNIHIAYCATPWDALYQETNDFINSPNEFTQSLIETYVTNLFNSAGFLIDETGVTLQKIRDALKKDSNSGINDNSSADDIGDFLSQHIVVDNDTITYDDSINTFINNYSLDYQSSNGYYVGYPLNIYDATDLTNFTNTISSVVSNNQVDYYISWLNQSGNYRLRLYKKSDCSLSLGSGSNSDYYSVNFTCSSGYQQYTFTGTNLTENSPYTSEFNTTLKLLKVPNRHTVSVSTSYFLCFNYYPIAFYSGVTSSNIAPMYYNNTVWEDYSQSSGDYVFSPTNINTVTYGDVVTYSNNYNTENNNYPDNSTVNNWITTTNTENITNGGGSGGENGGDDSGGGSSGDGIFDFLSDLGGVLGDLIKNLGQAITNIIKGVSIILL